MTASDRRRSLALRHAEIEKAADRHPPARSVRIRTFRCADEAGCPGGVIDRRIRGSETRRLYGTRPYRSRRTDGNNTTELHPRCRERSSKNRRSPHGRQDDSHRRRKSRGRAQAVSLRHVRSPLVGNRTDRRPRCVALSPLQRQQDYRFIRTRRMGRR